MRAVLIGVLVLGGCDTSRPMRVRLDAGVCPELPVADDALIDVRCAPSFCPVSLEHSGCDLVIENGCGLPALTLRGESVTSPGYDGCSLAGSTITCDGTTSCQLDVHARQEVPVWSVEQVAVVEDVPFLAERTSLEELLDAFDPFIGYATSSAIVGERLAVATDDGRRRPFRCLETEASSVRFVGEDLAIVATATAPPCLSALASEGDGFVGAFERDGLRLGRFDAGARLREDVLLTADCGAEAVFVVATVVDSARDRAVALASSFARTFVYVVDLETFTVTATSADLMPILRGATLLDSGMVVLGDRERTRLVTIDPATAEVVDIDPIDSTALTRRSDDVGFVWASGEDVLVSTTGGAGAVWKVRPSRGQVVDNALFFEEAAAVPWAIAGWGDDTVVGLVGAPPAYEARVAAFDLTHVGYRVPALPVGRGVVSELHVSASGTLWALLPWSGEVARIRRE